MKVDIPTFTDLPALITQGESETVEFMRSVAELEQVVETVAALANTRGGLVRLWQSQPIRGLARNLPPCND